MRFRNWLVSVPLPARGRRAQPFVRYRKDGSVNAVLGTMTQFLRFGVGPGWVSERVAASLSQPKCMRFLPAGVGGDGRDLRVVQERTLKFATTDPGIERFTPEQVELMIRLARNAHDRFMIVLMRPRACGSVRRLGCTGPTCTCSPTPTPWAALSADRTFSSPPPRQHQPCPGEVAKAAGPPRRR